LLENFHGPSCHHAMGRIGIGIGRIGIGRIRNAKKAKKA